MHELSYSLVIVINSAKPALVIPILILLSMISTISVLMVAD